MSIVESGYYSAPVWLQNLATSAYGLRLRRERYGKAALAQVRLLSGTERLDEEQLRSTQETLLVPLVRDALGEVPYYRDWAARAGMDPADFCTLDDLQKLPLTPKEAVRHDPKQFLRPTAKRLITLHTSGTTGSPTTVFVDADSRARHYAFFTRLRSWFGVGPRDWRATFLGRIIMRPGDATPPFWRWDRFQRNILFSSYHLSPANLPHYASALDKIRPAEVFGYPSSLFAVARHVLERGRPLPRPHLVMTTAETLQPEQRSAIEQAFGTRVTNQYGCTEMAFFASECEYGTMHFHPEHAVVEVLDEENRPCPPGKPGRLVATGLVNDSMVLLRYDVGDSLTMKTGGRRCACGRAFPMVDELTGRVDDVIVTPDGRPVGRLDPVFKGASGIEFAQIEQLETDLVVVRLVVRPEFSQANEAELRAEFAKRFGESMRLRFDYCDVIPRGPGGKQRSVIGLRTASRP